MKSGATEAGRALARIFDRRRRSSAFHDLCWRLRDIARMPAIAGASYHIFSRGWQGHAAPS